MYRCARHELRRRRRKERDRLEIGCQRGPKPPRVRRQDVNAMALWRKHAMDFGVHARKIRYVLEDVRREHDVDAGIRQRDGPAVVILDRKNPMGRIVRIRELDRADLKPAALQFQSLLPGPGSDFENTRACWKQRRDLVQFRHSNCVEVVKGQHSDTKGLIGDGGRRQSSRAPPAWPSAHARSAATDILRF